MHLGKDTAAQPPATPPASTLIEWIDARLPVFTLVDQEFGRFPCPKNFNYLWNFGALASAMMVIMIATGVFLAMDYQPNAQMAFGSVQHIMRDANLGWLVRSIHQVGSSMFFIVTYIHTFRGIYYGSYKRPRELLWILGMATLLVMMGAAFMGYVLPWGQMSYWGATVITNMFSAVPVVGETLVKWLWGGFAVGSPTLTRFYSLHYLLPFVLVGVVFLHIVAIHVVGSNNPLGIDVKSPQDTLPFHPFYTIKDCFGLCIFLAIFAAVVFFAPDLFSDPTNFVQADPIRTPADIRPEWYFLPFYAILRAVPDKLGGIVLMFGAMGLLLALPWLVPARCAAAASGQSSVRSFSFGLRASGCSAWSARTRPKGSGLSSGASARFTILASSSSRCPCSAGSKQRCPCPKASAGRF